MGASRHKPVEKTKTKEIDMGCNHNQSSTNGVLLGAVVGGLLVGACATFLTSKTGKKIKREFYENCDEFGDKIENFINDKVEDISGKAKETIESAKEQIDAMADFDNKDFRCGILVGGVLGSLLGAGGTIMYNASFQEKNHFDIVKNIGQQTEKWKKIIGDVLEVAEQAPVRKKIEKYGSSSMSELLDFAITGMKLWNNFRK
jgi:gas vesicle protein